MVSKVKNKIIQLSNYNKERKVKVESVKNIFYMLIGIPCSGKSFYAKNNFYNHNTIIISSDELRKELTGIYMFYKEQNKVIVDEAKKRIKHYLSLGYNVVYDATNTNKVYRKSFINIARNFNCEIISIVFKTSLEICLERNKLRSFARKVLEDKMMLFSSYNSKIDESEGFDRVNYV